MINHKVVSILILLSFPPSLFGMDGPMLFAFMAHIQNMSKHPITYIPCWGSYNVNRELDSRIIPCNSTLPIAPNQNGGIFKLVVAGVKHSIINVPDIVFAHLRRPHDIGATKRKSNGYRIKFDDYPYTEDFVPVIHGQCVYVKVDEADKITFEVKFDESAYLALQEEMKALQIAAKTS